MRGIGKRYLISMVVLLSLLGVSNQSSAILGISGIMTPDELYEELTKQSYPLDPNSDIYVIDVRNQIELKGGEGYPETDWGMPYWSDSRDTNRIPLWYNWLGQWGDSVQTTDFDDWLDQMVDDSVINTDSKIVLIGRRGTRATNAAGRMTGGEGSNTFTNVWLMCPSFEAGGEGGCAGIAGKGWKGRGYPVNYAGIPYVNFWFQGSRYPPRAGGIFEATENTIHFEAYIQHLRKRGAGIGIDKGIKNVTLWVWDSNGNNVVKDVNTSLPTGSSMLTRGHFEWDKTLDAGKSYIWNVMVYSVDGHQGWGYQGWGNRTFTIKGAEDSSKPRIVVLANSIDYTLASDLFGFLRNKGIEVLRVSATEFEQYNKEKFIVVLGGPDAPEGVGEILKNDAGNEVLTPEEQDEIRKGNRVRYVKTDIWDKGQKVIILAGSNRYQTQKAGLENEDSIASEVSS